MRTTTKVARIAALATLAIGIGVAAAAPSVAATPAQTCTKLTGSATFTPGLGPVPKDQTVNAKGTTTGCTPAATTGGSGVLSAVIKIKQASCAKLASGGQTLTGTAQSKWKNGKISNYALTFKTGTGAAITTATITGKVSSGLFVNKLVKGQIKFAPGAGQDCSAAHPIKSVTFTNTKPFVIG